MTIDDFERLGQTKYFILKGFLAAGSLSKKKKKRGRLQCLEMLNHVWYDLTEVIAAKPELRNLLKAHENELKCLIY